MKLFKVLLGVAIMSFLLVSCSGSGDIGKHKWKVRSINGATATNEKLAKLSLEFGEEQAVGGMAPCGEFKGKAVYNEDKVKFSTLSTQNKEQCEDASLESAYLASLEMSTTYSYTANRLVFYDSDGNITVEFEENDD